MEVILLHPLGVGGDGGALDGHAILFGGVGGVDGHLVAGLVPFRQTQVVVFRLQVHEGQQQLLFDLLPEDAGHLVPVHLHQGSGHFDLIHISYLVSVLGVVVNLAIVLL